MMQREKFIPLLLLISVLTATILSCSSLSNLPNPFASATPTATATFTPTITPSPTPTSTPTATPLPTGVQIELQADGSTLVRDWDNGYTLTLPSNWVGIPITKDDLDRMIQEASSDNQELRQVAESFRKMDPKVIRLLGINRDSKYSKGQSPALFVVMAISNPIAGGMPMDFVTAMIEDNVLKGATDTEYNVKNNAHGVEIGIVEGSMKIINAQGSKINTRSKVIAFQVNKKLVLVQFVTPAEFASQSLQSVEQVVESIQLIKP